MALYLGLDTSNYTTSVAVYDTDTEGVLQKKKLLPVKAGEKGLRQNDAVFHHTVQLPRIFSEINLYGRTISGIGVSTRPCSVEGSYMPCFLCGEGAAVMLGHLSDVPVYRTHHQMGHILAALYSAKSMHFLDAPFVAFHVSGGTTDCVFCVPDPKKVLHITPLSSSLDLKAGQLVDRVGLMLGLAFPCGSELERLALQSQKTFQYRPTLRELDCSLSGLENQCVKRFQEGESREDVAAFCLYAISEVLLEMTRRIIRKMGNIPIVYAGGVMSNIMIQKRLRQVEGTVFAKPQFSSDNAVGTAIYAALCAEQMEKTKWPY